MSYPGLYYCGSKQLRAAQVHGWDSLHSAIAKTSLQSVKPTQNNVHPQLHMARPDHDVWFQSQCPCIQGSQSHVAGLW